MSALTRLKIVLAAIVASSGFALATAGPAAARGDLFAAIAVEVPKGAYGYGFEYMSRGAAEARALDECETFAANPANCRKVVWVRNGCAAVAVIRRENGNIRRMAWGIAQTKPRAVTRAKNAAGDGSRLLVWVCSGRAPDKAARGGAAGI